MPLSPSRAASRKGRPEKVVALAVAAQRRAGRVRAGEADKALRLRRGLQNFPQRFLIHRLAVQIGGQRLQMPQPALQRQAQMFSLVVHAPGDGVEHQAFDFLPGAVRIGKKRRKAP